MIKDDFGIVIINNFINIDQANTIINEFENLDSKYKYGNNNIRIISVNPKIQYLKSILNNILNETQKLYNDELFLSEFMISSYNEGYKMGVHVDTVDEKDHFIATAVLYLNNDFSGGNIYFPKRKYVHSPKLGDLTIFDSGDENNAHGVEIVTSGKRYVMPVWMTNKEYMALTFLND